MKVKVEGAARKIDLIFRFDKTLFKEMQKEVRAAGSEVQKDAISRMPSSALSSWGLWFHRGRDISFESSKAKRISVSVRSKERAGFRRVKAKVGFSPGNAAGAIFGLAGSVAGTRSDFPQRSANFKRALNNQHGGSIGTRNSQTWPRALTPAYYAKGPQAREKIGAAIERMIAQVNR